MQVAVVVSPEPVYVPPLSLHSSGASSRPAAEDAELDPVSATGAAVSFAAANAGLIPPISNPVENTTATADFTIVWFMSNAIP
ncbi:MAG: hypothetical protein JWN03_8828 [Nocardia sp.]|nr:hypothetical protein [Nocardia sp.]